MLIRRRITVKKGSSNAVNDYEHEILEEVDYAESGDIRLFSTTAWIGPTEWAGMPTTVDVTVENTDSSDNIRFYYDWLASSYMEIAPGKSAHYPGLTWTAGGGEWRIQGQGAGLVDCRVTVVGDY